MDVKAEIIAVWRTLFESPGVTVHTVGRDWEMWGSEEITDAHIMALMESDGETTDAEEDDTEYVGLEVQFMSHGDYHGSDIDAANLRHAKEVWGDLINSAGNSRNTYGYLVLGENPDITDPDGYMDRVKQFADAMSGLWEYPLLNDEKHSEYVRECIDEAWGGGFSSMREELVYVLSRELFTHNGESLDSDSFGYGDDGDDWLYGLYVGSPEAEWVIEGSADAVNVAHGRTVAEVCREIIRQGLAVGAEEASTVFGVPELWVNDRVWFETLPGLWSAWPTVEGNTERIYCSRWQIEH